MKLIIKIVAAVLVAFGALLAMLGSLSAFVYVHQWGSGRFWNFAEAEAFLVPEDYRGGLTIVFGDTTVPRAPRIGMARLYDFRGGPVLRVRDSLPSGPRSPDWYLVDARGRRRHVLRGERCGHQPVAVPLVCPPFGRGAVGRYGGPSYEYETWVVVERWQDVGAVVNAPVPLDSVLLRPSPDMP